LSTGTIWQSVQSLKSFATAKTLTAGVPTVLKDAKKYAEKAKKV
jgi:hypothetical protein